MYTVMLMTNHSQHVLSVPYIVCDVSGGPFIAETIPQAQAFIDSWLSPFHNETYQIFKLSPIDPNKELS